MLSRSVLVPPLTQSLLLARVATLARWHASVPRLPGLGLGVLFFIRWAIVICPIAQGTVMVGGARVGDSGWGSGYSGDSVSVNTS